jgi:hypothetical protein
MTRFILLACALMSSGGCSQLLLGPDRVYSLDEQVSFLRSGGKPFLNPTTADDLNSYVTERIFEIDLEYNSYFSRLTRDSQVASVAGDSALLTLTALSTVAPASAVATKTALSAAATGVTGFKSAIDKDILLSHTVQILQSQMEASRALIRNRVMASLLSNKQGKSIYTVWQAHSDLEDYYRAGTLPGALEALAAVTGNNAQQTKDLSNGATQNGQSVQITNTSRNRDGAVVPTLRRP